MALLSSALDVFSASSCCAARRSASFRLAQTESFTASKVEFAQAAYKSKAVCCSCVALSNARRCASAVLAASVLSWSKLVCSPVNVTIVSASYVSCARCANSAAVLAAVLCESRSCFTASRAAEAFVL